jgi:hypothetical protein
MNCERCGIQIDIKIIDKRVSRGNNNRNCSDCNAKPTKKMATKCQPWTGEVDDDLNPVDSSGRPYRPGIRSCGYKDCVNRNHIIPDIEFERWDISYRTGRRATLQEVRRELSA